MISYEQLEDYYKSLNDAFNKGGASSHYNNDRSHNVMVMCFMLDKSSSINMYCGQLSLFSEDFFKLIAEDKEIEKNVSEKLREKLLISFQNFIRKDNVSFNVIFESFKGEYFDTFICKKEFLYGINKKSIYFHVLNDSLSFKDDLYHFAYTDSEIVRLEQDKIKHSAICNIKNIEIYNSAKKNFSQLLSLAQPIEI